MMERNERPVLTAFTFAVGAVTLAIGLVTVFWPSLARFGREWLIALVLILSGVCSAGFAATTLRKDVRVYTILMALLSIATGIIVAVHPLDTFITFTALMGLYFMIEAALLGGLGMSLRPHWTAVACILTMGAVSLVMSALVWSIMAGASRGVIVILVGITFIARGLMYLILAILMRGRAPLAPKSMEDDVPPESSEAPAENA